MEVKRDTNRIVDEAVGQTHGTPPPTEARERQSTSPEETIRRNAATPGPLASMAEKTAASIGERVGNAYSDTGSNQPSLPRHAAAGSSSRQNVADRALPAGQRMSRGILDQFSDQRLSIFVAAFGLGFIAAVLLNRRR